MRKPAALALLALAVATSACSAATSVPDATATPVAIRSASAGGPSAVPLPEPAGPLGGLHWPAPSLQPGTLLHDDKVHLSAVPLSDGQPQVLWSHPEADVYRFAASPDGRELALAVGIRSPSGVNSTVIYLLGDDGSVLTVRRTPGYWSVASMVFVRAPTDLKGPVRLYWTEASDGSKFDMTTDSYPTRVMSYDGSTVQRVDVPMPWGQSALLLDAYPGNSTSTLMAFRRDNIPTRYQVLRNNDMSAGATLSSPTTWGYWETIVDTDLPTQVAWLSPDEYVVGYGHSIHTESNIPSYSLKRFRVGCEWAGSNTFWSGSNLDAGVTDAIWRMLAPDPTHVLVLGRALSTGSTPWLSVDVNTGKVTRTSAVWTPEGAWTVVRSAEKPTNGIHSCGGVKWSWP